MDFFALENPPFDVISEVPTLIALPGCLDFELEQVTLHAGNKEAGPPFEYATVETHDEVYDSKSNDFSNDEKIERKLKKMV